MASCLISRASAMPMTGTRWSTRNIASLVRERGRATARRSFDGDDLHTGRASLLDHVRRAPPAGEGNNKIRLSFLKHPTVSDRPCSAAVFVPIRRKRQNLAGVAGALSLSTVAAGTVTAGRALAALPAAADQRDPIFAVIERHRELSARYSAAVRLSGNMTGNDPGFESVAERDRPAGATRG
jgi:hypothetical protein